MAQHDLTAQQLAQIADSARVWQVQRFCQVMPSVVKYERGNRGSEGEQSISEPNGALAALLRCVIYHLGADLAMISLLDDHTQYFISGASRANMQDAKATLESTRWYGCDTVNLHGGLCQRTIVQHNSPGTLAFYEELDMANTERTKDLPFVKGDIAKFRHYAGVPLNPYEGPNIGTVFLFTEAPSESSRSEAICVYLTETARHINKHLEQAVEALEGQRALRYNRGITSLLETSISAEAATFTQGYSSLEQPLLSDRYSDDALRLYRLSATTLCDIFDLDGVWIQEVGPLGHSSVSSTGWTGSSIMARHIARDARQPRSLSVSLSDSLVRLHPTGAVFQVMQGSGVVIVATGSMTAAPANKTESVLLTENFLRASQIMMMPLWDTHHERNIGAVLGFTCDQSKTCLGPNDLSSLSAFCATVMTQVRRLDVQAMIQMKSDFLGSISHEMRTPLHGILSNLELLAETKDENDRNDLMEMARYSAPAEFETVFTNLLDNALKFGDPAGCVRIRLKDEGASIKLSFQDTGSGIAPDFVRHRIFEPFSQENPQNEGTGLGLSLVQHAANALDGEVKIKSDYANDDNSINLKVISMFAGKASSIPSTSVSSGREAILTFTEARIKQPYDLIFLDLSMPEISGFEVAKEIRELEASADDEKFVKSLSNRTGWITYHDRLESEEARKIPYVTVSNGKQRDKKLRIFIQGGQHGNEPAGDEDVLALLGELAADSQWTAKVLEKVDLLILPRYNVDGVEYLQRQLASNYDPNRDHAVLLREQTRKIRQLQSDFNPHIFVDDHEYTGGSPVAQRYIRSQDLLVSANKGLNVHPSIRALNEAFVTDVFSAAQARGLRTYAYSTTSVLNGKITIQEPDAHAQANHKGVGNYQALTFLVETRGIRLADQHFQRRVASHFITLTTIIDKAVKEFKTVYTTIEDGRKAFTKSEKDIVVVQDYRLSNKTVQFIDAADGSLVNVEVLSQNSDPAVPVLTCQRPKAYLFSRAWADVASRLRILGVKVEEFTEPFEGEVEALIVTNAILARSKFEGIAGTTVVTNSTTRHVRIPAGGFWVDTRQENAAYAFVLLEPENKASLAYYNEIPLQVGDEYLVFRVL
ncbi:hypothetical protein N0V91_008019 [Didymella pomorum]|uniref:histidine kinase n=1 Tax=Didymella pomorum TaxID=749634 RepID=A0A9W9D4T9_9PLEO|nr:hypothetical protein N0V91_008019 [Didymella pomorum]